MGDGLRRIAEVVLAVAAVTAVVHVVTMAVLRRLAGREGAGRRPSSSSGRWRGPSSPW